MVCSKEPQYRWDNCHISQSDVVLYSPDPPFPLAVLKGGRTRLWFSKCGALVAEVQKFAI